MKQTFFGMAATCEHRLDKPLQMVLKGCTLLDSGQMPDLLRVRLEVTTRTGEQAAQVFPFTHFVH
jgi:hypothetical protein